MNSLVPTFLRATDVVLNLQAVWQAIQRLYQANQEPIDNLLSGALITLALAVFGAIWWYIQQRRQRHFPPDTFPFEVIRPNGNILQRAFGEGEKGNDPLANSQIPYQRRIANLHIQQELEKRLNESRWLLILGGTGLGKTREAAELAQLLNREGWTVLNLRVGAWLDVPTREQLAEIGTNRKLLFFLDDLNQKMHFSRDEPSPRARGYPLEPLTVPLQERLLRALEDYEQFCGKEEIRVVATARDEKHSEKPEEPSQWEKLEWKKYPRLWQRFKVYELPEPEDGAVVQLLSGTVPQTNISAKEEDFPEIARRNDCTFSNVVENLVKLRNRGLPLTPKNYRDTLTKTWQGRYQDAVQNYPIAKHIYKAVDLLRRFDLPLERFTVEPTALLMVQGNFWQQLWCRWKIRRVLTYLIEAERILTPRDGQIEAQGRQVEAGEYSYRLTHLILQLADKHPQEMQASLLGFGGELSNLNRNREALDVFNRVLASVYDLSIIWFLRGTALVKLDRYEEAVASYDEAVKLKPDYHEAWYNRGYALDDLGHYEEAVASYDKAVKLKPNNHQAWYNRGIALGNLGRYEEAVASYDEALKFKPDYHEAWYNRGTALGKFGRYEEAVASFDQAVKFKPDYHQAWNSRGIALVKLDRYEEAVASYDEALKFKPDNHQAWYNRGVALGNLGRYQETVASFNQAVKLKPDDHEAWYNRGIVQENLGHYEEAVASYDEALKLKPDDHQAWYNRGTALGNLGRYEEAVASFDQAVKLKPDYHEAWNSRGIALEKLGRYEEAVASFEQAVTFKPDDHGAWYNRGIVQGNLGRHEQAVASYDKAVKLKPDYHEAWNSRGIALWNLGRYEEAVASYDEALKLKPDDANTSYYNKACCYALQSKVDLALDNLQQAINLSPEYREIAKTDTDFDSIRSDERFLALIQDN